jgi:predicted mannosyl-3-phosphoglycerate phosphatase (HAD superfamily)
MPVEWTSPPDRVDRSILILTCVDGALRNSTAGPCTSAREAVAALAARRVPVILTSYHPRAELLAVQEELGLDEPFIAENGAALGVPRGYFARLPQVSTPNGRWEIIDLDPPSVEDAIEMLMWLYRVSGDSPLLVGVGSSWKDHLLLRHVDVPVLVNNPSEDQRQLRAHFPDAYLTSSPGPYGWSEAILGSSVVRAD